MDIAAVRYLMGKLFLAFAGTMLIPFVAALILGETAWGFAAAAFAAFSFGGLCILTGSADGKWSMRESFAVVTLTWIIAGSLAGLPFWLSGNTSFMNAMFEGVSGLTCTGATIFADVEALPRSVLLWRSLTHFLGGMGILVFFVLFMPKTGSSANLFRAEASGPEKSKAMPRFKDAAFIIWWIYLSFTLLEIVLLKFVARLPLFDAVNHAMSNVATGGFHVRNAGVRAYDSAAAEIITVVFMVLGGVNFSLYIYLLRRNIREVIRSTELRIYFLLLAAGWGFVSFSLVLAGGRTPGAALPEAICQVTAMMTTTGFAWTNYADWPYFAVMTGVILMFIGGCAGSTSGGLKVARIVILARMSEAHLKQMVQPQLVAEVRMDGQPAPETVQRGVFLFFTIYVGVFTMAVWLLTAAGLPPLEAMGAVLASLGNVGMGLGSIGAAGHFAGLGALCQLILTLCMLLGRLEVLTLLVLIQPGFWRGRRNW
ncbi:MAG: TrkH family potassium uptake protein [Gracilibacteraceae bacterium]|jgi:trk system potassium uptake protein TrkH|nr:TrkH family potassium uptake protein [Gracilibacteraceae bacterium]